MGFVALALGMWRWQNRSPYLRLGIVAWYVFGAIVVGIAVQYPTPDGTPETIADIETTLNNQRPTLVMLYSDY
jgi:hypothetical protein